MPIDPFHLDKERRRPAAVNSRTPARTAWIVFVTGLCALAIFFLSATGSRAVARVFQVVTGGAVSLGTLIAIIEGYKEDGWFGAWFRSEYPLGSALEPTSRPRSPVAIALIGLLGIAVILSVLLFVI